MKILVLDDDHGRLKIFRKNIEERLHVFNANYVETSKDAIDCLALNPDYDYIFLDHDLGVEGHPNGTGMIWDDGNNGMLVVDWLINNNYSKVSNIIIHSWNIVRAREMEQKLS